MMVARPWRRWISQPAVAGGVAKGGVRASMRWSSGKSGGEFAGVPSAWQGRGIPAVAEAAAEGHSVIDPATKARFWADGFCVVPDVITQAQASGVRARFDPLFRGDFDTGIYPDEWHWREGLSFPDATREIVNAWKADSAVAAVALAPRIGAMAADLMGWARGTRIAQDDALWKPPGAKGVGYHQDAAYISDQFLPRDDNSVTIWIALDDADADTGVVEYARGSHRWFDQAIHTTAESSFHGGGDPRAPARVAAAAADEAFEVVAVEVPTGAAVFHHQDVWHGSGSNTTADRPRRALALHMIRRDVEFRTEPAPDYIYGRYKLQGSVTVEETFFPTVWAPAPAR